MTRQRLLMAERQRRILERVAEAGSLDLASLAEDLGVSVMTVRRDVKDLSARGRLSLTRGGATVAVIHDQELLTNPRAVAQADEKALIGRRAAALVQPGEVVFLGTGSTTAQLVAFLDPGLQPTVITASLPHATVLASRGVHVISTGGVVAGADLAQSGPRALDTIHQYVPGTAFIGAQGVCPQAGLTEAEPTIAEINRAAIGVCERVVLLIDSTKVGRRHPYRVASLTVVSEILTTTLGHRRAADLGWSARDRRRLSHGPDAHEAAS